MEDAVFEQLPGYATVVRSCWQAHAWRRPDARTVHKQLVALLKSATGSQQA